MKLIIFGNSGSGKSTLAKRLISERSPTKPADPIAYLSLDHIAWNPQVQRKPLDESIALLQAFVEQESQWIIEGCYGDLVAAALPYCDELWFLNPGVDTCLNHCRQRPWEPDKFASSEEQDAVLNSLMEWVRSYESRTDEFGLHRHRQVFDGFTGRKREFKGVADYDKSIPLYSGDCSKMSTPLETDIQAVEEALKQAMLTSDVEALDRLLADDLSFTNHLGQLMSKQADLEAHRSGAIAIESVELSDQTIRDLGDTAIVTVAAHIVGQFAGSPFAETLRFTRVWQAVAPDQWQVIVAHSSRVGV